MRANIDISRYNSRRKGAKSMAAMRINKILKDVSLEIESEKRLMIHMEKRKGRLPEGALSVCSRGDRKYYYQKIYADGEKTSILLDSKKPAHRKIIKELMEKKIIFHGVPILRKNIEALEKCQSTIRPYHPGNFKYGVFLGSEYYLEDDTCIKEWEAKPDQQNKYRPEELVHGTKRGIYVRSKSEALIADILYDLGIRVKYETILIAGRKTMYPDFEFIHPKTGKIIWWEHYGIIDDPGYAVKAFEKQDAYASIGIYPGENLIITWEAKGKPLTRDIVEEKLRQFDVI